MPFLQLSCSPGSCTLGHSWPRKALPKLKSCRSYQVPASLWRIDSLNSWHRHSLHSLDNHVSFYDTAECSFTTHIPPIFRSGCKRLRNTHHSLNHYLVFSICLWLCPSCHWVPQLQKQCFWWCQTVGRPNCDGFLEYLHKSFKTQYSGMLNWIIGALSP